jgi:hypothetical protein
MTWAKAAFAWGDTLVGFHSDWAVDTRWLEGFLRPWFTNGRLADISPRIAISHDEEAFASLHRVFEDSRPDPTPCFALDSEVISNPGFHADGVQYVYDHFLRAFYVVRGHSSITVVTRPGELRARFAASRIIRDLARGATSGSAWVGLHAAAVDLDGCGLLLAGPRKSGKTTLLAYLLSASGATLIANDWVMVRRGDATEMKMRGMPTIVRIRPETARLVPALSDLNRKSFLLDPTDDVDKIAPQPPSPAQPGERYARLADFAATLGARSRAEAPVSALLFPCHGGEATEPLLTPLGQDEATRRLVGARYGQDTGHHAPTLFGGACTLSTVEQVAAIGKSVPAFDVSIPKAAFANQRAAMDIRVAVCDAAVGVRR